MRFLSGIQPSGRLHLGNYFGAMRQQIELQEKGEPFYFIANLHSLNSVQDAAKLRELTRDVALDYLALGLDPSRTALFRQSDIPEVTELAWILSTVTGMGLLERAHAYKDKLEKGLAANVGLFYYPVLMAADILIYKADAVPVGKDQVQHIEMTRDMAGYFNQAWSPVFHMPKEIVRADAGTIPGVDGQKMSKSYGNAIPIFAEGPELKKLVMGIKTDSAPVEASKNPDENTIYLLYKQVAKPDEAAAMAEAFRKGGLGYGDAKKQLLAAIDAYFAPARDKRKSLKPEAVEAVLQDGAARARRVAQETMRAVREAVGI